MNYAKKYSFQDVLRLLKDQKPEDKLRLFFKLNLFVKKIREAGSNYGNSIQEHRPRATS